MCLRSASGADGRRGIGVGGRACVIVGEREGEFRGLTWGERPRGRGVDMDFVVIGVGERIRIVEVSLLAEETVMRGDTDEGC